MRRIALLVILLTSLVAAQTAVEKSVLQNVRKMMAESGGRVTFSSLANDPTFTREEKAFLGRLYEIFFQIPGVLKSEFESTGEIPSRAELGANFGISAHSVDLLLAVMKSDPRMPPLFDLDGSTREITSLKIPNIEAFLKQRGTTVRVTQWEGKALPTFDLTSLEGGQVNNASIDGNPALLYFWFTGCPPCGRISPHLVALQKKYGDSIRIVGMNADKVLGLSTSDEQRAAYLKKLHINFVNTHLDDATRKAFGGINIYPTLFFADGSGTIVDHFINYQPMEALDAAAERLIEGSGR